MLYRGSLKSCVLATSSAAVIGVALAAAGAAPAFAQEETATSDRVVVTGSRIARRDFTANSPIVTVDSEAFENQSGINAESYLNQLPQFNPAAAPTQLQGSGSNSDVQPTANNSVGIATLSLRGLGANRNLVLVDGRRQVPVNALMITDLNAIPSALIQRVEIITGGASAVYGADAVGGVVNFILRDDFEGLEIDTQYGFTEVSDGEEFRISGLMGTNFADGRGNVTMGLEHYSRSVAWQNNRDFFTDAWADPFVGTNEFFAVTHGWTATRNGQPNGPSTAAVNALFAGRPAGTNICPANNCLSTQTGDFNFNPDGTIWRPNAGAYRFRGEVDGSNYAFQNVYDTNSAAPGTSGPLLQTIKSNNEFNYASSPQTRYSIFASGTYDITDSLTFFARGSFAESDTSTRLFPSPAITGWGVDIPYDPNVDSPILGTSLTTPNPNFIASGQPGAEHPVSPELAYLLNSRVVHTFCQTGAAGCGAPGTQATTNAALVGTAVPLTGPTQPWQLKFIPDDWFADRSTVDTTTIWQVEAGLRGELPFLQDWTWDAYISHGESATYNINNGNFSLERYQAMILADDYGRNAVIQGNQESPNFGFGVATGRCGSGFYDTIFGGDVPPSADCIASVAATLQGRTQSQQDIAEANIQGSLFNLPAGEVQMALGAQYRENAIQYYPDILQSTSSFIDQVIGVYPTAYMNASTYAREVYGELVVPVVSDLPFVELFSLELYSDYEHSPNEWTYKILGDWQITDFLRARGGYNRATRAPNVGELFLGDQQFFGAGGNYGDPCGFRSNAPFGAGGAGEDPNPILINTPEALAPGQTAAGAESTEAICRALMGTAGQAAFYGPTSNQPPATGGGFAFLRQVGNPNLDSETADTWTAGLVFTSPWENPWLANLTLSADWYQLEITDAIQQQTVDQVRFACYGTTIVSTPAEAAAQAATPACQAVQRNQGTGAELQALLSYDNQATIETSGVDVALNWGSEFEELGADMIPGGLNLNVQLGVLDYYRTKASEGSFDPVIDWKGSLGPTLQGTNAGAYDYKVFTTFSYFTGPTSFSLRWRHLPEVDPTAIATQNAIIENNARVQAGGEGIIIAYTPTTAVPVKDYDIFDLSINWDINERLSFRGGIDNLLDKKPNRTGETRGYPAGTVLNQVCSSGGFGAGCQNPFGFSLPNPGAGTTNGGYYDTLGRRFFVGLKARL
jgi:outer membrane receptor protein involved in Fe transport